MDVSVIIVNYNTADHLEKCLFSIIENTKNIDYEILICDNNSPDRDIEKLQCKFTNVNFFFRSSNDGFGAGCNYCAGKSRGKYLLFVNPDILIKGNAIIKFYEFMENNSEVGLCSGLQVDGDNNLQYSYNEFPDLSWEYKEAISRGTDKRINQLLNEIIEKANENISEVDWVIGACMFVRKVLFEKAGGFDETFFLYYEDVDLQYRIREYGYKIIILTDVRIFHFQRSSVRDIKGSDTYFYNMHKSKLIFIKKHYGLVKRFSIRLLFIIGFSLRIITEPFRKANSAYTKTQLKNILKLYLCNY